MNAKILKIAIDYAKAKGEVIETYDTNISQESGLWVVDFSPKDKNRLGGGFRIEIDKNTLVVKKFLYYQ